MEDSRKGKTDGEKELSTPNPHVDEGKCKQAIVYNTKGGRIVDFEVIILEHVRGYFLYLYKRITLSF